MISSMHLSFFFELRVVLFFFFFSKLVIHLIISNDNLADRVIFDTIERIL